MVDFFYHGYIFNKSGGFCNNIFFLKTAIYGWFVDVIYLVTLRKALDYMYLQSNDKL